MRRLIYITAALILLAMSAGASEAADYGPVITTTDGCICHRGSDGQYYVVHNPAMKVKNVGCICGDNCSCAPGVCPSKCPVAPAVYPPQFAYPIPGVYQFAAPSCAGGSCGVPQRGFRQR